MSCNHGKAFCVWCIGNLRLGFFAFPKHSSVYLQRSPRCHRVYTAVWGKETEGGTHLLVAGTAQKISGESLISTPVFTHLLFAPEAREFLGFCRADWLLPPCSSLSSENMAFWACFIHQPIPDHFLFLVSPFPSSPASSLPSFLVLQKVFPFGPRLGEVSKVVKKLPRERQGERLREVRRKP